MTRRVAIVLTMALLLALPAQASDTTGQWDSHRPLANALSNASVYSQIGLALWKDLHAKDEQAALTCTGLHLAIAAGTSMVIKHFVHRERPDGSDNKSVPSQHTAIVTALAGWNLSVGIPIAAFTGYGRVAAGKHHWTDVAAGAGIGAAGSLFCRE